VRQPACAHQPLLACFANAPVHAVSLNALARAGTTDEAYWADYDVWEIEQVLDQLAVTGVPCGAWPLAAQHEFPGRAAVGRCQRRRCSREATWLPTSANIYHVKQADAPHWLTRHACRARQAEQAASIPLVQRLLADIPMWKPTLFFHEGDISYARCGALAVAVCTSCAGRGAVCGSL